MFVDVRQVRSNSFVTFGAGSAGVISNRIQPMKNIVLVLILSTAFVSLAAAQQTTEKELSRTENGQGIIVYSEGGAFMIQGPTGWVADSERGQRLGICCVFYAEGATWDDAETVIYPNIATKRPGQNTLKEFMDYDLSGFRESNPAMTYEEGPDIPLRNHAVAKTRLFHGVNKGSSEAIAYIDEDKVIALVVVSSRTQKGLNAAMPLLREMLQTYSHMDVRFTSGAKPAN